MKLRNKERFWDEKTSVRGWRQRWWTTAGVQERPEGTEESTAAEGRRSFTERSHGDVTIASCLLDTITALTTVHVAVYIKCSCTSKLDSAEIVILRIKPSVQWAVNSYLPRSIPRLLHSFLRWPNQWLTRVSISQCAAPRALETEIALLPPGRLIHVSGRAIITSLHRICVPWGTEIYTRPHTFCH